MKLSYLIPTTSYSFFSEIVPLLERAGIKVYINSIPDDTDLILAAILPMTPEWIEAIERTDKPFILWHWDLYSFVDLNEARWRRFLDLFSRALEVWSCTYEVARQLKEARGQDSYMIPAWVNPEELDKYPRRIGDYAFYAAGGAGLGKRIDWAERACTLLGYKLMVIRGQPHSREAYLDLLTGCRVYLMPAFEESNGTIPAMEAMYLGKPVVAADLPSSKEVFGDAAYYFRAWEFSGLLQTLSAAWENARPLSGLLDEYELPQVASRIVVRLAELSLRLPNHQS